MRGVLVIVVMLAPSLTYADRKSFTQTYEYATLPEGQTEVELWHTQSRDTWDTSTPQRFEEKLEIEHGITDSWDAAMYTTFTQVAGNAMTAEPFGLDSISIETRYRFADRGQLPVDPVAYFEVAKDFGKGIYELEGKAILARDFDRITVAANLISAVKVGHDVAKTEVELSGAAGATYEVTPKLRFGAETWASHLGDVDKLSVGPAIGLAPAPKLWLAVTFGFGVNHDADAFSGRLVMGLSL